MQTRTDDNFTDKKAYLDNFSSDLVSRDAMTSSQIPYRAQKYSYLRPTLSQFSGWWSQAIVRERQHGAQFLFNSTAFIFGTALWFSWTKEPPLIFIMTVGIASAIILFVAKVRTGKLPAAIITLLLFTGGGIAAQIETWRKDTTILDSHITTTVRGIVERREADHRGHWRYEIRLTGTADPTIRRSPERVMLAARQKHQAFPIGSEIRGRARLSPPSGPTQIGGNDFAFAAYFNGIGASGFFYKLPEHANRAQSDLCLSSWFLSFDRQLYLLRSGIAERIRETIGGDAGALSASMVTDERRAISPEVMDALRKSGLAHIVAISGLNMALAAGIFFVGLRVLFSLSQQLSEGYSTKKIAASLALVMTLIYYLISGFAVSAQRAWIMMSAMLIAVLLDRPAISMRNVAISALVIGAFSP